MKHLFTLLVALCIGATAMAQKESRIYTINPTPASITPKFNKLGNIPEKLRKAREYENFTLEDGQYLVGTNHDDAFAQYGSIFPGVNEVGALILSPYFSKLKNAKVLGTRFCLWEDCELRNVLFMDENLEHDAPLARVIINEGKKGWNYVEFPEPIPMEKMGEGGMICFTYVEEEDHYPLCNWGTYHYGGFYHMEKKEDWNGFGDPYEWHDFTGYAGDLCIQLVVEADPLADYDVEPYQIYEVPQGQGNPGEIIMTTVSNSGKEVTSIEYTITRGKNVFTNEVDLPDPIQPGLNEQNTYYVPTPVIDKFGKYTCHLKITKVNGVPVEEPKDMTYTQEVYSRVAPRFSVVEEYTGTACGWCPMGWVGMEYIKNTYPDEGCVIALHQYNGDDPMANYNYKGLSFNGAPQCMIDRVSGSIDPYKGTGQGIDVDFEYWNSYVPSVEVINLSGVYTKDLKSVVCDAEVEFLNNDANEYTLAFVLTVDSLDGKKNKWPQQNYFADHEMYQILPQMPELADFLYGQAMGQSRVGLVFNDVMIGSSYSDGTNKNKTLGRSHTPGQIVASTYTTPITAKDDVLRVMNPDLVSLTALVLNKDGEIANAKRVQVVRPGEETAIQEVTTGNGKLDMNAPIYDLQGRRVTKIQHGIYIQNGRKVLVK